MHSLDPDIRIAYLIMGCVMFLLVGASALLIHRVKRRRPEAIQDIRSRFRYIQMGFTLEGIALMTVALLGQNRLLHAAACGVGIAASVMLLAGIVTCLRKPRIAR